MPDVVLVGDRDRNDEVVAAALARTLGVEVSLVEGGGSSLASACVGARLIVHPDGPGRGVLVDSLRVALDLRIPWLGLSTSLDATRACLNLDGEARTRGVPAIVSGGPLPGLTTAQARQLVETLPGADKLVITYTLHGLESEPAGAGAAAAALRSRMDVWRDRHFVKVSPLSQSRPPLPGRAAVGGLYPWPEGFTLGESLFLDTVETRLALPIPTILARWGAHLPGQGVLERLRRFSPHIAPGRGLDLHITVSAPFRTQQYQLALEDRRHALAVCLSCLAEPLLGWRTPLGVQPAERALPPHELLELLAARGLPRGEIVDLPHVVTGRVAHQLYILAP